MTISPLGSRRSGLSPVFAVVNADYRNLGDVIIRRRVIAACPPSVDLHVYTGAGGKDWIESLYLPATAHVYTAKQRSNWLRTFVSHRGRHSFLIEPGEVRLRKVDRRPQLALLGMTVLARSKGATVIRPPRGIVGDDPLSLHAQRLGARVSTVAAWRNEPSRQAMRCGSVVPDVGVHAELGALEGTRPYIVLSLRGDRPVPPEPLLTALRGFASAHALEVVVASQVEADDLRTTELASKLGAPAVTMGGVSMLAHESVINRIYAASAAVVSDRLHALILGANQGAAPINFALRGAKKIQDVFAVMGLDDVSVDADGFELADYRQALQEAVSKWSDRHPRYVQASIDVEAFLRDLSALMWEVS